MTHSHPLLVWDLETSGIYVQLFHNTTAVYIVCLLMITFSYIECFTVSIGLHVDEMQVGSEPIQLDIAQPDTRMESRGMESEPAPSLSPPPGPEWGWGEGGGVTAAPVSLLTSSTSCIDVQVHGVGE